MALHLPRKRSLIALAASSALALIATDRALAQDSSASKVENLGTVEVSGQSRNQQLQNVPIAMQVLSASSLKEIGATSLGDLDNFIPGLQIDASQPTQPGYTMRGLGAGDFGIGSDSPVGMYINGVYAGKTGGALMNFNDVKRIEVLSGPQGTLFGRNAAAGAISIVQNDPGGEFEANGLVRVGNQGTRHYEALVNLPLNDSTALRISTVGQDRKGYVKNTFDGSEAGGEHTWGTRAALRWSGDETSAVLTWEHEQLQQKARPVWALNASGANPYDTSAWLDPRSQPLANDSNPNIEARLFNGVTLRVEHSLPFAELTSTTAYRHFNARNIEDNDGTANVNTYLSTGNIEANTTWQQEFKLNGHNSLSNWVVGVSAYGESADQDSSLLTNTNSLDPLLAPAFAQLAGLSAPPFATLTGAAQQLGAATGLGSLASANLLNGQSWQEDMLNHGNYRAYAVYGDVIWRLSAQDNLTTGLRFTRDEKTFSWNSPLRQAPALDAQLSDMVQNFQTLTFFNLPQPAASQLPGLIQLAQVLSGQTPAFGNIEFNNAQSVAGKVISHNAWNNTSPRLVYDHHLSANHMLFASWTKGYQAGGFGWSMPQSSYQPEYVTSVEIGAKGQFKQAGLYYNATAFHYNFTNLQLLTFIPATSSQIASYYDISTSNQKATGLDLGLQWRVNSTWRLSGALEYIDQTYGNYSKQETDPNTGSTVNVNLSGAPVGTPSLMATLSADATWRLADGQANFGLVLGYKSATRCNADSAYSYGCLKTPSFQIGGAQSRVDMRLGWTAPSTKWGVGLIVNNATNQRYVRGPSTTAAQLGEIYTSYTPPRATMVEFSAKL
jgi:iron complex outermembrane receptor protein